MTFHPATQILIWCLLVVALQKLAFSALMFVAVIVILLALLVATHKLLQLFRRTRWIMFSLLLIYAYSTPGQAWFEGFGMLSPTYEGLQDGSLQLLRLLTALASLAILLTRLPRQQLIAGLYTLFAPLQWLRLSRARVAVRLALTLQYAEVAMLRKQTWQLLLQSLFASPESSQHQIELPLQRFSIADASLLLSAFIFFWMTLP